MMLKSRLKVQLRAPGGGIFSPFRRWFCSSPPRHAHLAPRLGVAKQWRGFFGGVALGFFRVFWVFQGSAAAGERAAFSPPCPRMFLLILNLTRRHFEGADFLAKKMTSASLVWSFFLPF